jgi:hypothetical protein
VEIHGKVLSSILAPGSGVAEGEVTSSLMGPLVGFHHQSLLIAAFWPAGRGNVGYGANVGSNHTSRLSDQSLWPGEGVFFGLGSSSKFPLNMSEAPYTTVATGVSWGPGRLNLPFSLVTEGSRIAPGWSILSNAYQLERAFVKGKSRAPAGYAAQPIRASMMNLVWMALTRLRAAVKLADGVDKITESPAAVGLGLAGGYITRGDVEKGIRAYEFVLELYALRTAWDAFAGDFDAALLRASLSSSPSGAGLESFDPADTGMEVDAVTVTREHASVVLHETILRRHQAVAGVNCTATMLLDTYIRHEERWSTLVYESKRRDHDRGATVFPPGKYDEGVVELGKDPVIASARDRAARVRSLRGAVL